MRPLAWVVGKKAGGGNEGHHVEETAADGWFQTVSVLPHQLYDDERRECQDHEEIELELRTAKQCGDAALRGCHIQQREVGACYEAEERQDVLDGWREQRVVAVYGETSGGCRRKRIVDAAEYVHSCQHQ